MRDEIADLRAQLQAAEARLQRSEARCDELIRQLGEQTQAHTEQVKAQTQKLDEQTQAHTEQMKALTQAHTEQMKAQTQAIERLRKEFKDQREADRGMVERNLRGLLEMHRSTVNDLKLTQKTPTKTLQATSNRSHMIRISPGTPENWRKFCERQNQENEELERQREITEIYFNHGARKPTSKASRKRSYEQSVKTNDTSITDVIIKTKDEVHTRLQASVEVRLPSLWFSFLL